MQYLSTGKYTPTYGRLISLPTVETITRLKDILSQPPLRLDPLPTYHVTVARAYSQASYEKLVHQANKILPLSDGQVMEFRFTDFDYLFDPRFSASKIVGAIECNALEPVHKLSETFGVGHQMVMQFLHAAPPLSGGIKSFVVSIADTLIMKEKAPFTLHGLYPLTEEEYNQMYRTHHINGLNEWIGHASV